MLAIILIRQCVKRLSLTTLSLIMAPNNKRMPILGKPEKFILEMILAHELKKGWQLINQYFDPNQYFPQGVTMLEFESFSLSPEKPKD